MYASLQAPPARTQPLPSVTIGGRRALPIVQGGMGVGVSAHRLAGSVARLGAVGTLSSIDLRHHHPDLVATPTRDRATIERANLVALDRELRAALAIAAGHGIVAVNVMRAVSQYADYVRQACESGAHAIVVGAGLPLDLPDLAKDFPDVALVPILSDSRGIKVVLTKWMRKGRLPDAIVIEHPKHAGGHLGAADLASLGDPRFEFARVLAETHAIFAELGIASERIPLVVAGGISTPAQVRHWLTHGAAAVQLGTPFAVSAEGDAHPNFKRVLAEAKPEDIVEFMSVAGLPARAVRTPWLARYLAHLDALERHRKPRGECTLGWDCLARCGLRDGTPGTGRFCIDMKLAAALDGDVNRGLFFRGAGPLPFGSEIRPVRDLVEHMLDLPAGTLAAAA